MAELPGSSSPGPSLSSDAFLSLGCMEGLFDSIVTPARAPEKAARAAAALRPGYVLAIGVTGFAYLLHFAPIVPFTVASEGGVRHPVSAAIIAILIGLLLRNTMSLPDSVKVGCKHAVKRVIPLAIVCIGAGLNLADLYAVGGTVLAITVVSIGVAVGLGYACSRLLGLGRKTAVLLGAGTGICGNSAIVAVAPLIDAEDDDVVLSVGTVNLMGLLAMLAWPVVGGWLEMDDGAFGVWSGTSIHAVPQVVAAGFAYGADAGTMATLVKLVRVAFLAPMVFALAVVHARHRGVGASGDGGLTVHYARLVPWFVWGFMAFALVNTFGLIPTLHFDLAEVISGETRHVSVSVGAGLSVAGKVLLTIALAAIGLEVNVRQLGQVGGRAIAAGLFSTAALGASSLFLITIFL